MKKISVDGVNLSSYIKKSNTSGLVKNDGTIDTSTYLTSVPSHNQTSDSITDMTTKTMEVTFDDSTTKTYVVFVQEQEDD